MRVIGQFAPIETARSDPANFLNAVIAGKDLVANFQSLNGNFAAGRRDHGAWGKAGHEFTDPAVGKQVVALASVPIGINGRGQFKRPDWQRLKRHLISVKAEFCLFEFFKILYCKESSEVTILYCLKS